MTVEDLVPGSILCLRYRLEKDLLPDRLGSVLLCRDLRNHESRVVVRLLDVAIEDDQRSLHLRQNFSNLNRLQHPSLARVLDLGVLGPRGGCYLVEEHVPGMDLFHATEGWCLEHVLRALSRICHVLQFLHVRGIVHGSLRPSHVLVPDDRMVPEAIKVVGLGVLSAQSNGTHVPSSSTIAYTAPEVLLGQAPSPRSDLYSLGILAYQLLTRRLPFEQGNHGYLLQKHLQGRADMRPIGRLEWGAGLVQAVSALLEKEPEKRPSTAEDVTRLLNAASGRDLSAIASDTQETFFSASPFVSREQEMQFLRDRAHRVRETGRGWTVFLSGEGGSGKSRCMEEFRLWAQLKGWRVVEGSCRPHERRSYGPYREIFEIDEGNRAPDSGEEAEIFRFTESREGTSPDSLSLSSESAAAQFRDLLTRELVRRLSGGPTILFLHDFHWADRATTTVLDYLISDILAHPILLCVSLRPGEAGPSPVAGVMEQALRQEHAENLSLESLPESAVTELIAGMTVDEVLGVALGPILHRATGGNPFFIEEMLKHFVDRGVLQRWKGRWRLEQDGLSSLEVPGSIALVLRHRLQTLSRSARTLAGWLSIFGRPVSRDLLRAAIPGRNMALEEPLSELLARQVLRANPVGGAELFDFRHTLISEVIQSDLSRAERRKMHRCIGEALEGLKSSEANLQELATHFTEGDCGDKAARFALKAATACRAEFAHESALRFYEYALRHGNLFPKDQLCQMGIEAAEVCCALGEAKRAVKILEEQLRRGRSLPPHSKAWVYAHLAKCYRHSGNNQMQDKNANKGLKLLNSKGVRDDSLARALLLKELAFLECVRSHPGRCSLLLTKALDALSGQKYDALSGQIYITMSVMGWLGGDIRAALAAGEKAIAILQEQSDLHTLPIAYSQVGICLTSLGRFREAVPKHNRAVELSDRTHGITLRAQALTNLAECLCRCGQLSEATRISEIVLRLQKESANPSLSHAIRSTIAEIKLTTGDYLGVCKLLEHLQSSGERDAPVYSRVQRLYISACLAFELGNDASALAKIRQLHRAESVEVPAQHAELGGVLKARILLRLDRIAEATRVLRSINSSIPPKRRRYQTCLARMALAEALLKGCDPLQAGKPIRDLMRLSKAMPSQHLQASAHLLAARMHLMVKNRQMTRVRQLDESPVAVNVVPASGIVSMELAEALRLAKASGQRELIWRVHAEMATLEEMNANPAAAASHAESAIECMNEIEARVPAANLDSYRNIPERLHTRSNCERLLRDARAASFRDSAFPEMEEEHLRILFRFSSAIASMRDLEPLLDAITNELLHSVGVERVLVFLKEESEGALRLSRGRTRNGDQVEACHSVDHEILEEVYHSCAPFVSANAQTDARLSGRRKSAGGMPGTVFCGPLASGGKTLGVMYADHSRPSALPGESTINFLAAFCNLAASAIDNSLVHRHLVQENIDLERHLRRVRDGCGEIVGESPAMMRLRDRIAMVAASPLDALIAGESGTGKELVARALHRNGKRASGNFIGVDCGSLADTLAESEFFGYRKGAFTGAVENRAGLLEAAHGGVIFLDEISNLSVRLQGKFLRVLQEREVRRIGETIHRKIDVQVFAATNKDLRLEVEKGRFRKDLYYRLNAMQIRVPPLRERMEDVPLLAAGFLENASRMEGGRAKNFSRDAMDLLLRYSYPGNVRELKNVVLSSYYSCPGRVIRIEHIPQEVRDGDGGMIGEDERTARLLYDQMHKGKGNFDGLVKQPFQGHRIAQGTVRQLLHMALTETAGRYRDAFRLLRIPAKDYSSVMVFLKRHGCYLDFRHYRHREGNDVQEK